MDLMKLATTVGLKEGATADEVLAAIEAKFKADAGGDEGAGGDAGAEGAADSGESTSGDAETGAAETAVEAAHAESAELKTKVLALEAKDARREESDAVEAAIKSRKFLPKQREQLLTLCADVGVEKFIKLADSQVEQVDVRELGHAGSESDLAAYAPTRAQMDVARSMHPGGVPADHVKRMTLANAEAAGVTITTNTEG